MPYITLQDTPLILSPNQLATDQGWIITGQTARHDGCFPGVIILETEEAEAGKTYQVIYEVSEYTSGSVYPVVGGVSGTPVSQLGRVTEQITVPEDATDLAVYFYSDGTLGVDYFGIYPILADSNNGTVIGFNSDENKFTTYFRFNMGMMFKFINDFISFDSGKLYFHNSSEVPRNFFYGIQYTSEITILVNSNPTTIKNIFTARLKSNKAWAITNIETPPSYGKSQGQRSRIKKGNFKPLNNGDFFAAFLRDMNTPGMTELEALMGGALLQGSYFEITLENTDTTPLRTLSMDFELSPQQYSY